METRPHLLGWIQEWKKMSPHLGVDQEVEMLEIGKSKKEDALPVVSPDVELRGKTVEGDDQSEENLDEPAVYSDVQVLEIELKMMLKY